MRIGIEAQRIFRPKKHGMDIVVLEILRQLQRIPSEHQFVVFVKDDEDRSCLQSSDNMQIVTVPGRTYLDWEQIGLPKAVSKTGVDLLHCTSNTAPFRVKVPTVITLHDIIYLEKLVFTGTAYQNLGNVYRRFNVPSSVRKASKIITVSEYEKERITQRLRLSDSGVDVVYNGINPSFELMEEGDLVDFRKEKKLPRKFILSLGNQAPKKNMRGSIEAYLKYRALSSDPMPLVLVECTPQFLTDTLSSLEAEDVRSHIHLTGYIPHNELPKLYNLSHTFIYPSFRESFGIPILEANACGIPVITSNTSSMPEVAGGSALLINPEVTEDLAFALVQLDDNTTLRSEMIQKGLENAAKYNWRIAAFKTLDIYREILN